MNWHCHNHKFVTRALSYSKFHHFDTIPAYDEQTDVLMDA